MTDIFPPPPVPPPAVSKPSLPQTAVAHNPPSNILSLPIGASLDGVVISQIPQSNSVEIETHLGRLLLQSTADLGLDNYLQLMLQRKSPYLQFIIKNNLVSGTNNSQTAQSLSAHIGKSEPQKLATTGPAAPSLLVPNNVQSPISAQKVLAEGQIKVEIGSIVRATLLTAHRSDNLNSHSNYSKIFSLQNGLLHAGSQILNTVKKGVAKFVPGNGPGTALTQRAYLPFTFSAGSKLNVQIIDILTPANGTVDQRSDLSVRSGHVFFGVVSSRLPSGFPVIDTGIGRLVLETAADIATGSRLCMQLVSLPQAQPLNTRLSASAPPPLWLGLPALTETVDFIEQLPSDVRANVPSPAIPRADSQLTSTVLFFLSALKGGNLRTWLPDQTSAFLTAEKPDLLRRLTDEFVQIARPFNEGTSGDWRTAIIPVLGGTYLENFQMSFRKGGVGGEDKVDEKDARFIIDVTLSKFGRVQLDGLVISGKNKFDLFVRSEASFPKMMRLGIIDIFSEFIEISGVKGTLSFQSQTHFVDVSSVRGGSREDVYLVI